MNTARGMCMFEPAMGTVCMQGDCVYARGLCVCKGTVYARGLCVCKGTVCKGTVCMQGDCMYEHRKGTACMNTARGLYV